MNARLRCITQGTAIIAAALWSTSCGNVVRQGRGPTIMVIDGLQAASGAAVGQFSGFLNPDVQVLVKQTIHGQQVTLPTIVNDVGKVTLRMVLKESGSPANEATTTPVNSITLNRYLVVFRRAD